MNILIVDDSPMARKILRKQFSNKSNINILEASDGLEAIEIYRKEELDVMFLDLTMPNLDGYGVLNELKSDLNCLIIVVSADIQEEAQNRVKNMGAIGFIKKPVDYDSVMNLLKQYGFTIED